MISTKLRRVHCVVLVAVLAIATMATSLMAAPLGTATFQLQVQGSPTDYTHCTLITFANASYDVFGTPVNLGTQAGQAFCMGTVVGGVPQGPSTCESTIAGALSFQFNADVICDPTNCLGNFSFATNSVGNVDGTVPASIGDVSLTFDGYGSFTTFGPVSMAGCPDLGGGPQYTGSFGMNAFQSVATVPGDNDITTSTTFFNPVTNEEVDISLDISFGNVDGAGSTVVTAVSNVAGEISSNFAAAAGGYQVAYLDIVTTAEYTPPITICTTYADSNGDGIVDGTTVPEAALSFLHQESGEFVDRTSSRDPVNNEICATVDSLSFFGVFVRTTGICSTVGQACDDGNTCTATDVCNSSLECIGSGAIDCDDGSVCTDDSCQSPSGCVHLAPTAPACVATAKSSIKIKRDEVNPAKSNFTFTWQGGSPMMQADFGSPTTVSTDDYRICIYDGDGLVYEAELPAQTSCGDKDCWSPISDKGYKYKDKAGSVVGVTGAQLKASTKPDRNKVQAKGKGANMSFVQSPGQLSLPVSARVTRSGTSLCFEGLYATPAEIKKNDGVQFKGKQVVE